MNQPGRIGSNFVSVLTRADPRSSAAGPSSIGFAEPLQYFANLFVVTLLVVADKGNGGHAIYLPEERMFED